MTAAVAESPMACRAQEGKFLSFVLGSEEYGLEILKVHEINGMTGITCVPRTPDYVRGVLNLRGRVIPIVSLRRKFEMPDVEDTEKTCIIVVEVNHQGTEITMGIVVDEVSEVLNITADQIDPGPLPGGGLENTGFVSGMGKLADKVVVLLDIDKVLSRVEIEAIIQSAT